MMDSYDSYGRSPPPLARASSTRERDDFGRSTDPYRERRRSPDPRRDRERERERRDRRRSRSPALIDRYQPSDRLPRDDYYGSRGRDDAHRDRRRSSPPPQAIDRYVPGPDAPPPQVLINPLPDPLKLDFQVGFTWFAEWWRTEQRIKDEKKGIRRQSRGEREGREERDADRPKIQAAYDAYKEQLQRMQAVTFVRLHKNEDWFRERYDAPVRDPFRQKLAGFRRGLHATWVADLENGMFDEFTLEGIYKNESNGLGGILEKEEGETTAAAEVLGVGDLVPMKGGDLRDDMAMQPTLLIKTIAPTVTRENFEAFAREYLGEEEGGYKWLSLSDPNPLKKCHRMGWIMLNDGVAPETNEERPEPDTRGAKDGEDGEDTEMKTDVPANLASSPSEQALHNINGKTIEDPERGNFTVHCGVHRPPDAPRKKALWDLFSAPERISRDLELATRLVQKLDTELGAEHTGLEKIEQRVSDMLAEGQLQAPEPVVKPPNPERDPDNLEEGEDENMENENGEVKEDDEQDDLDLVIKKRKLDMLVEYLRRVYNFCFFCVFESDSVHELQRKCPGGHLRRPRTSLTSAAKETARASASGEPFPLRQPELKKEPGPPEDGELEGSPVDEKRFSRPLGKGAQQLQRAYNWVKTFEDKILQMLEPENMDLLKIGGQDVEEGYEEEMKKFIKQEDVNKWRCKVPECAKLFKTEAFWRKHVEKRHEDFSNHIRADVQLVNTYVLDPAHIAPSRSDANSNGHFPLNNHIPTGTPRGFQLQQHMPMGMGMPGGPTASFNGMPGYFPVHPPIGMQAGWGPPGADFAAHQAGPMRNMRAFGGNGAIGYRMPGPYDRNGARGGGPMRMDGRPRMGSMGSGSRLEGGASTLGPKEATLGRALKSYEDLDAAGGGGGDAAPELNY